MLKLTVDYYRRRRQELATRFPHKYLLLSQEQLVAVHDHWDDAYFDAMQRFEPGTFLIEPSTPAVRASDPRGAASDLALPV